MKNLFLGLLMAGAALGPSANADTMDEVVGNVVVVNFADGVEIRYSFHDDNTFTADWQNGSLTGSWYLQGDDICIDAMQDDSGAECEDYPKDHKVGDSWTQVDDDDGSLITISIVAGSGESADAEQDQESDPSNEPEGDFENDSAAPEDQASEDGDQDDSGESEDDSE